jgi:hypothetical protein
MNLFYKVLACIWISSLQVNAQDSSGLIRPEVLTDSIVRKSAISAGRNQLLLMISREQRKADASDGVIDQRLDIDGDLEKSTAITTALFKRSNSTVAYIENNETDDMVKRKYLGRVIENLKIFNADINDGRVDIPYYTALFEHTYQVIRGLHNQNLSEYVSKHIGKPLYAISSLFETDEQATEVLMKGMSDAFPEVLIRRLRTIKMPLLQMLLSQIRPPEIQKLS